MEVIEVTQDPRQPSRQRLIQRILDLRAGAGGDGVGIYGAQVCQICGAIDYYCGFADAMGTHFKPEFVCLSCRKRILGGITGMSERLRLVREVLDKQDHRYCELCQTPIDVPALGGKRMMYMCSPCYDEIIRNDPDADVWNLVVEFKRRRYLELFVKPNELGDFADLMDEFRRELDERTGD